MKLKISNKFKNVFKNFKFGVKQHGPEILIAGGVVGVITSAVLACVSTTKLKQIVGNANQKIKNIHDENANDDKNLVSEELKKKLTKVYLGTGFKIIKLYMPSVILGGLSLTSIIASNNILKKRFAALAAAYATVDKSFKNYRNRVIERFGEEVDKEFRYDILKDKITETDIDKETGEKRKTEKEILKTSYDGVSDFARVFDGKNPNYKFDDDCNLYFLRQMQSYFNDKLVVDGFVYLNDVYEELGFEKTMAGQVVGWIYDKKNNKRGDNYIDFGITKLCTKEEDEAIEYGYLLDFNVDGDILTYAHKE